MKNIIKETKIPKFLNTEYKDFCLYVIESRGIPSAIDSITPVQRLILSNAQPDFEKTLSLSGRCISDGYHHGDSSLNGAIGNLAKSYLSSFPILEMSGFAGNQVAPQPASPRYTRVRLNSKINTILKQYSSLNKYDEITEARFPLNVDFPIGLLNVTMGIAVGFATSILPRKFDEIQKFLKGNENVELLPYFIDYSDNLDENKGGKVVRDDENPNKYTFYPNYEVLPDKNNIIIKISEVCPLLKLQSLLKKFEKFLTLYPKVKFINKSAEKIEINLIINKNYFTEELLNEAIKCCIVNFVENITYTYNSKLIEYNNIKEYLTDFKRYSKEVVYINYLKYQKSVAEFNYKQLDWIIKFIKFMLEKKRIEDEIDEFLKTVDNNKIKNYLDGFKLRNCSITKLNEYKNELEKTYININELSEKIDKCSKNVKINGEYFVSTKNSKGDSNINELYEFMKEYEYQSDDIEENIFNDLETEE